MSKQIALDHSHSQTLVISAIYPVGPAAVILMPLIVGGMIDSFSFSAQQAGAIATAEGMGMVVSLLVAALWVRRINWRTGLVGGLLTYAALNILSTFTDGHTSLLVMRFLTGFAGGAVFAITVAAFGDNREPDRAFGYGQAVQGLLMGAIFVLAPDVMQAYGVFGVFYLMAGLGILCLLFIPRFPHKGEILTEVAGTSDNQAAAMPWLYIGLFGGFLYYIAVFGFWGFIERIGLQAGLDANTIGDALGLSQLAAIVGALLAAAAAQRFGRTLPLCIALVGQWLVLWALVGQFSSLEFYASACAYQGLYVMATSYQLGVISTLDNKGKFIVIMTALQGLGAAIGPSAAAWLVQDSGYTSLNMAAAAALTVSLGVFILITLLKRNRG